MIAQWAHVLEKAHELREVWTQRAAPNVNRHRAEETSRGLMRVIMRAWREATDDVRAGAAKWADRWDLALKHELPTARTYRCVCNFGTTSRLDFWRHSRECGPTMPSISINGDSGNTPFEHHTLARRLKIENTSMIGTELGWRVRVLLKWQRLVRAEKIQRQRRQHEIWRSAERRWHARRMEEHTEVLQQCNDWGDRSEKRKRGHAYNWDKQQEVMDANKGTTSGAAAVIARREQRTLNGNTSGHKRERNTQSERQAATAEGNTGTTIQQRTRRHDGQLVLTPGALAQIMRGKISQRRGRLQFGDG